MTWVKICGITNLEDAQAAIAAGADALGFVFYDRSPRCVDSASASAIARELPAEVETVGVFVDQTPKFMIDTAQAAGLKAIQWHPLARAAKLQPEDQGSTACCAGNLRVYWALPAAGFTWVPRGQRLGIAGIFLDSGTVEHPGGTGKPFDWNAARSLVKNMTEDVNVIIAGGLTSLNVADAIRALRPYGVDVSSGVEAAPGKKDPTKVRAFIRAVREADKTA